MANPRICKIEGCDKPHYSLGWCQTHYARWRKHGDPMVVARKKAQAFFEDVVLPYDGDDCLTWPFTRTNKGYGQIRVDGKCHNVSRRVCEIVHGPAPTPKHEAAHSCGNGHEGCVTKGHLSWKTPLGNAADRVVHGTHQRGEQVNGAKLSEDDVLSIRRMIGNMPQNEIAVRFGISRSAVGLIAQGRRWAWLS